MPLGIDRCVAAALLLLAAASVLPAAEPPPVEDGPLVLAMFAQPWENHWKRTAVSVARRFDARIEFVWVLESLDETCVAFRLPGSSETGAFVEALREKRRVLLAEPVREFRTLAAPDWNDTYVALQPSLDELGLASAQRVSTGRGVRVAVIDTGVDLSHPELAGRVADARSFVDRGEESFTSDVHGTAVAGVIAAAANNGIGIVGVAPQAEIVALKACWPDPPGSRTAVCDTYTLARALDYAILSGAPILNLSLAGPEDELLSRLLDRAEARGQLVVAAVDDTGELPFPASHPTALAVRSENSGVALPPQPTDGQGELSAPGVDILTTGPGGTYDFFTGSSLAAAHVAGIAALVLEREPGIAPAESRRILRAALRAGGASPGTRGACAALAAAMGFDVCPAAVPGTATGDARDPL